MSASPGPPPRPRQRRSIGVPAVPAGPVLDGTAGTQPERESPRPVTNLPPSSRPPLDHAPSRSVAGRAPVRKAVEEPGERKAVTTAMPGQAEVTIPPHNAPGRRASGVKVDLRGAAKERQAARRRLLAHRVIVAALILAGIGGTTWAVFFSPLFALSTQQVTVSSSQSGAVEEGIAVSDVLPVIDGYAGTPLPRLPIARIEEELVSVPAIAVADVTRTWPRGLNIDVVERVPLAQVQIEGGYALVGIDGETVTTVGEVVPELPLVTVSATEAPKIKTQAASAVAVWESLPSTMREQVAAISVAGSVVTLDLFDGAQVVWGSSEESDVKAQVLELLVQQRPSAVYDLRDPRRPVTR